MFIYPAHLDVRRPSPTTVGFAVSNAPPETTLPFRVLSYIFAILRICLSLCVVALIASKLQCTIEARTQVESTDKLTCPPWLEPVQFIYEKIAFRYPWHFFGPGALIVLYVCCLRLHTEESLLVLQSLGIQTSTSSGTYLSTATTRFIPTSEIQDIFIHEAFIGFEVRYYLAIVVKNEPELTVVFPKLLPRRAILEEVWRGSRTCLFANLQSGPGVPRNHSRSATAKT